jgi:ADP-ribose pyrophosphatase YjhB (NUDIX family)
MPAPTPLFCSQCASPLTASRTAADGPSRRVCTSCGEIVYDNPRVLVTTIVATDDRVLLCRRADPPAAGCWTLPGGFMESHETLAEAAARETREETGVSLDPRNLRMYGVAAMPEISEIYVGFLAPVPTDAVLLCGPECTEVGFFDENDLPWSQLAYADIAYYLRVYFDERRNGRHVIHFGHLQNSIATDTSFRIDSITELHRPRS